MHNQFNFYRVLVLRLNGSVVIQLLVYDKEHSAKRKDLPSIYPVISSLLKITRRVAAGTGKRERGEKES